jgi:hypothetical protein
MGGTKGYMKKKRSASFPDVRNSAWLRSLACAVPMCVFNHSKRRPIGVVPGPKTPVLICAVYKENVKDLATNS